jgi:hypothetical protein
LEESLTDLAHHLKERPRYRSSNPLLAKHYDNLAIVFTRLGETTLAAEATRKASALGRGHTGWNK